jgi:Chlorophyllase enzyme
VLNPYCFRHLSRGRQSLLGLVAWLLIACEPAAEKPATAQSDSAVGLGVGEAGVPPGGGSASADAGGAAASGDAGGASVQDGGGASRQDAAAGADAATAEPGDGGTADASATGCGANLLPVPEDLKQRGPWDVGVRTVKIGRLTVELMYPAKPGSSAGKAETTYDIRSWLPQQEVAKVPADHSPAVGPIGGHFYRDLPIDEEHGPYPVVIFIHGTASFRIASASTNAHWASRGFVVLAADYPGLGLGDQLSGTLDCDYPTSGEQDLPGDVKTQMDALNQASGDLAFLAKRIDMTRVGISGHSQGGCVSATLSGLPNVRIVMPWSGATAVEPSSTLESIMYVSGIDDQVIGYTELGIGIVVCPLGSLTTETAFEGSPGAPKVKKRMVGISGGGHLVVTDLCQKNVQGKNAIEEAAADGVCGIDSAVIIGLPALFDCGTIDWKVGVEAVNYVTTAALEETLHCKDRSQQFASLKANLPQVGDFRDETSAKPTP